MTTSEVPKSVSKPNKLRRYGLPVALAAGGLALAAAIPVVLAEGANDYPQLRTDEAATVVHHTTILAHSQVVAGVPQDVATEYELDVLQHQPGKTGANDAGDVEFEIPVAKDRYDQTHDGDQLMPTQADADAAELIS